MSHLNESARRIAKLAGTRRGSMLIMVIVILVLLALIGTAMMSTSRIDRVATQQHAQNTEIDLLVESVENMAKAAITAPMYSTDAGHTFRRGTGYVDYDSYGATGSTGRTFLANRHPAYDTATAVPYWPWVSAPLLGSTFESPISATSYTLRQNVRPTSITFTDGSGTVQEYPAINDGGTIRLAADVDGDGVADGGLFRLPIGTYNGLTYYASVRIIDNNSAVNASTAFSNLFDSIDGSTASASRVPNYGFFPSNISLNEMLVSGVTGGDDKALNTFNLWRFNELGGTLAALTVGSPVLDNGPNGTAVPDFQFKIPNADTTFGASLNSIGNLMNVQLAQRLQNPGFYQVNTRFKALPISESLTLAYRFCLQNKYASPSILESKTSQYTGLLNSLVNTGYDPSTSTSKTWNQYVPTKPYKVSSTDSYAALNKWYADNFDFTNEVAGNTTINRPLRTCLVARNGVQNLIPTPTVAVLPAGYLSSTGETNKIPLPLTTTTPVGLTSVNTANFTKLWRAFWLVMSGGGTTTVPHPDFSGTTGTAHMFNPTLRYPIANASNWTLSANSAFEMMMLRSALAAVNTLDMRTAGREGTTTTSREYITQSRQIALNDTTNATTYTARVYGCEPQPYVTEVYASGDTYGSGAAGLNQGGYVAIELYNPYPFQISLKNWQIARVTRPTAAAGAVTVSPIATFAGFTDSTGTTPALIAPNSYIVLENFSEAGTVTSPTDAKMRPTPVATQMLALAATQKVYVTGLGELLNNTTSSTPSEFVLLKPRRMILNTTTNLLENDAYSSGTDTGNVFNETGNSTPSATTLPELVPADQFDFTGFQFLPADGSYNEIHYVRQNGANNNWKFVYPGRYDPEGTAFLQTSGPASFAFRQEGIHVMNVQTTVTVDPWDAGEPTTPIALGAADTGSTYDNQYVAPLQIMNVDAAGPFPQQKYTTKVNQFPYGGFARNGDMLMVPFIGSYRLAQGTGTTIAEMNAVTMDASYAKAGGLTSRLDETNQDYEQIGHFSPESGMPAYGNPATQPTSQPSGSFTDYYDWTKRLFNYLCVWTPADDYFPNVDPNAVDTTITPSAAYTAAAPDLYPPGSATYPQAVQNGTATPYDNRSGTGNEDAVSMHSLINLNTASAYVLSALPWVPPDPTTGNALDVLSYDPATGRMTPGANGVPDNLDIAKLIVDRRDGTHWMLSRTTAELTTFPNLSPFTSVADLNKVSAHNDATGAPVTFSNCFGVINRTTGVFTPAALNWNKFGDLSPTPGSITASVTADGVLGDVEKNNVMLNRVSNLVTMRSDTYTVYVLVQGWAGAGTATPTLVVQRRAALIVDRTGLPNGSLSTINIPSD